VSREVAIRALAEYLESAVSSAKGRAVSISVSRIGKWHENRLFAEELSRGVKYRINLILKALHRRGYVERVGKKFILHRGSPLWDAAIKREAAKFLEEFVRSLGPEAEGPERPLYESNSI